MAMGYPIRNRNEDTLQVFQKALPRCTACIRGVRRLTVQAHGTQNGLCAGCAQWGGRGRESCQWRAHSVASDQC